MLYINPGSLGILEGLMMAFCKGLNMLHFTHESPSVNTTLNSGRGCMFWVKIITCYQA